MAQREHDSDAFRERDEASFDVVGPQPECTCTGLAGDRCALHKQYHHPEPETQDSLLKPYEPIYELAARQLILSPSLLRQLGLVGWEVWALEQNPYGGPREYELRNYQRGEPHLRAVRAVSAMTGEPSGFLGTGANAVMVDLLDCTFEDDGWIKEPLLTPVCVAGKCEVKGPVFGTELRDAVLRHHGIDLNAPQTGAEVFKPIGVIMNNAKDGDMVSVMFPGRQPQFGVEASDYYGKFPTDSQARKDAPIATGFLDYFPDAIFDAARLSKASNDKHNPGEPLHWSRGKSNDHRDTMLRHTAQSRELDTDPTGTFLHATKALWRAAAECQLAIEELRARGITYPPEK